MLNSKIRTPYIGGGYGKLDLRGEQFQDWQADASIHEALMRVFRESRIMHTPNYDEVLRRLGPRRPLRLRHSRKVTRRLLDAWRDCHVRESGETSRHRTHNTTLCAVAKTMKARTGQYQEERKKRENYKHGRWLLFNDH